MQHIWVANQSYGGGFPPGFSDCIEGPYVSPSGASLFYDISDTLGDAMDVSIVPHGYACDGASGLAVTSYTSWGGRLSPSTGPQPGGAYDLALNCNNFVYPCQPFLYAFGYED